MFCISFYKIWRLLLYIFSDYDSTFEKCNDFEIPTNNLIVDFWTIRYFWFVFYRPQFYKEDCSAIFLNLKMEKCFILKMFAIDRSWTSDTTLNYFDLPTCFTFQTFLPLKAYVLLYRCRCLSPSETCIFYSTKIVYMTWKVHVWYIYSTS